MSCPLLVGLEQMGLQHDPALMLPVAAVLSWLPPPMWYVEGEWASGSVGLCAVVEYVRCLQRRSGQGLVLWLRRYLAVWPVPAAIPMSRLGRPAGQIR